MKKVFAFIVTLVLSMNVLAASENAEVLNITDFLKESGFSNVSNVEVGVPESFHSNLLNLGGSTLNETGYYKNNGFEYEWGAVREIHFKSGALNFNCHFKINKATDGSSNANIWLGDCDVEADHTVSQLDVELNH